MTSPEQDLILGMVEEGRVSAQEGLALLRALDQDSAEDKRKDVKAAPGLESETNGREDAPQADVSLDEVAQRARRWARLPLWFGAGMTLLSAALMYWAQRTSGFGFWFYCLIFPFASGSLLTALSAVSVSARWLFVDVRQRPGQRPARLMFGFPLPLRFVRWLLWAFERQAHTRVLGFSDVVDRTLASNAPLILHVRDEDGEQVNLYIG